MSSKCCYEFYIEAWQSAPGYYALMRRDPDSGTAVVLIVSSLEHCCGLRDELEALNEVAKDFIYVEAFANVGSLRPSFQINCRDSASDLSKLSLI